MSIERDPSRVALQEGNLKLSGDKIFYTLQGEGVSMGEPAVFLRTHLCNLQCVWCDTPYTWNRDMDEFWTEPEDVPTTEAAQRIRDAWGAKNPDIQKRVIFTGGEPLLQQDAILEVIDELGEDWKVEVETNGTMLPREELLDRAQFNVSPKLENSGNMARVRIRPDVIRRLAEGDTTFKFVVTKPDELDEIQRDYIDGCDVQPEQVILMPEGTDPESIREHAQEVAEYAKEKGFRMLGRLQVDIWGKQRGV